MIPLSSFSTLSFIKSGNGSPYILLAFSYTIVLTISTEFSIRGAKGTPPVSLITSTSSHKENIFKGLVITISSLNFLSKNLKLSNISSVVLKCCDGIKVILDLARSCLPPPGTF